MNQKQQGQDQAELPIPGWENVDMNTFGRLEYHLDIGDRQFSLQEMSQEETDTYAEQLAQQSARDIALVKDSVKAIQYDTGYVMDTTGGFADGPVMREIQVPKLETLKPAIELYGKLKVSINDIRASLLHPADGKPPVDGEWLYRNSTHRILDLIDRIQFKLNGMEDNTDPHFLLGRVVLPAMAALQNLDQETKEAFSSENLGEELGSLSGPELPADTESDPTSPPTSIPVDNSSSSSEG